MSCFLLTGAGFSRNWGGWLASEAFEYLLGRPEIAQSEGLKRLLWSAQPKGGFEDALADLQVATKRGDETAGEYLKLLSDAVEAMFDDMNVGYEERATWEFTNDVACSVSKFLTRFEAIFTLNQDLLVERHYLDSSPYLNRPDRWDGVGTPGIQADHASASIIGRRWQVLGKDQFKLHSRIQPYFKLHGSSNWLGPDGAATLIVGGNKSQAILGTPILNWYQAEFEKRLFSGSARLMVIGYGFRDEHSNDLIIKAMREHDLKIFNISPEGADHARAVNPTKGAGIYAPNELDDAFERGLAGASRRGLAEIFGSNGNELAKLHRFVDAG